MMDPGGGEFDPRPDLRCARPPPKPGLPDTTPGCYNETEIPREFRPRPSPLAVRLEPSPDLFLPPITRASGTWETYAVDNQEPFLRAFGSAFHTGAPAVVRPKELHVLTHDRDGGALEDTLVLGDTAVVNRTRIGRACEIMGPDGAAMTVTARWDGDVWVEVDDALVMETRRWREGELLVVARTVTNDDGTLVTSKAFMGAPRKRAPAFEAASPGAVLALSPPGAPALLSAASSSAATAK